MKEVSIDWIKNQQKEFTSKSDIRIEMRSNTEIPSAANVTTLKASTLEISEDNLLNLFTTQELNIIDFGTLEINRWILDDTIKVISDIKRQENAGWISKQISSDNKLFYDEKDNEIHPYIQFFFTAREDSPQMVTITFDKARDGFATDFRVESLQNNKLLDYINIEDNQAMHCIVPLKTVNATSIKVIIKKWNLSHRRIRIARVLLGGLLTWQRNDVRHFNYRAENSPILTRLPIDEITFEIADTYGFFDPLNPKGIFNSIREGFLIYVDYGFEIPFEDEINEEEIEEGIVERRFPKEWIKAGRWQLSKWSYSTSNRVVSFTGQNQMFFHTNALVGNLNPADTGNIEIFDLINEIQAPLTIDTSQIYSTVNNVEVRGGFNQQDRVVDQIQLLTQAAVSWLDFNEDRQLRMINSFNKESSKKYHLKKLQQFNLAEIEMTIDPKSIELTWNPFDGAGSLEFIKNLTTPIGNNISRPSFSATPTSIEIQSEIRPHPQFGHIIQEVRRRARGRGNVITRQILTRRVTIPIDWQNYPDIPSNSVNRNLTLLMHSQPSPSFIGNGFHFLESISGERYIDFRFFRDDIISVTGEWGHFTQWTNIRNSHQPQPNAPTLRVSAPNVGLPTGNISTNLTVRATWGAEPEPPILNMFGITPVYVDNRFIMHREQSLNLQRHIGDWVKRRKTVTVDCRIDPRIEILDDITIDTNFSEEKMTVTSLDITYNGWYTGRIGGVLHNDD